ncbi:sodium/hydrogen exchanger family protein [Litorimonas taeanensis]|uniref:Sodium/hydrogen exchanger family protein n=1 Tax=Litorimonas taeanensis TaxID=568099 RepID=A0A420WJ71_9PROT|nr:potassium/proton antiporter [Litorimonas taeanensis]RKQ70965.1 sodium/hydrogen exchanger family protein [Litorimonas taeanensis]
MYPLIALISLAILISLALFPLARKSGTPLLLVILAVGMMAGEDGFGGIQFDNFQLAFDLGSVALAFILFAGGVETDKGVFKSSGVPALILAFPGVIITAAVVGVGAYLVLDMPLMIALLLGAVVAPTDAAATFMLIQQGGLNIPDRVKNTLLLESGFNDPAGICLTIILTVIVGTTLQSNPHEWLGYGKLIASQFGFGIIGGIVGGRWLVELLNRLPMPVGTYPVLAIFGALFIFSVTGMVGGSGFLAIYMAGIAVRNGLKVPLERIANFSEGMQWVSQIMLFLILGLLVTPSELPSAIMPAIICALILTFVARPIAVFTSLGAMKFNIRELTFLSWVGLRGAVPILLAIYPVITPGPVTPLFFNIVFVIVVASLILQGFTAGALGRVLNLDEGLKTPPL